jgi:tetratricopeptide (TPR) repeat protein
VLPDVVGDELERPVLAELRTLPDTLAKRVGQHLVMVGRLVEEDPDAALEHAQAARDLAPRVSILRETLGIAAYSAGDFSKALQELKAARRISGNDDLLPLIADAERGLGRPDRALEVVESAPKRLPADTAVELLIVGAGARRDLGDPDAAVLMLQRPELNAPVGPGWLARLRYAFADALRAAGRTREAAKWFELAEEADIEGELDWSDLASDPDAEQGGREEGPL